MAAPSSTTAEFGAHFPTWADLRRYIAAQARYPQFDEDRALHQILSADLATRMSAGDDWLLLGSLSLPLRVPTTMPWPDDLLVPGITTIDPAYVAPRTAFDLDLYAAGIARRVDPADIGQLYGAAVMAAIHAATAPAAQPAAESGRGLGGLIAYTPGELRQYGNGQVMGTVTAQPIDPRYSARGLKPVDDPITVEIDIKPPSKLTASGRPEEPTRPLTAIPLPGFHPIQMQLYPLAEQLADKLCLLTGPPVSLRNPPAGAWHRYKDVLDAYFVVRTCPLAADLIRPALDGNWNLTRLGMDCIPRPYRLYGQQPIPPGEPAVPWHEGCEKLRTGFPQLQLYPPFEDMITEIKRLVDGAHAPSAHLWVPGQGWTNRSGAPLDSPAMPGHEDPSESRPGEAPPTALPGPGRAARLAAQFDSPTPAGPASPSDRRPTSQPRPQSRSAIPPRHVR